MEILVSEAGGFVYRCTSGGRVTSTRRCNIQRLPLTETNFVIYTVALLMMRPPCKKMLSDKQNRSSDPIKLEPIRMDIIFAVQAWIEKVVYILFVTKAIHTHKDNCDRKSAEKNA